MACADLALVKILLWKSRFISHSFNGSTIMLQVKLSLGGGRWHLCYKFLLQYLNKLLHYFSAES
jgi:hypothetical protein